MAFQVSPGVEIKEIDLTNIIPAVSTTSTGFAGFFNWGPVGQRINISSVNQLNEVFRGPDDANANHWFTAANFLAYGSNLNVVRVVDSTSKNSGTSQGILIKNTDAYNALSDSDYENEFIGKFPGGVVTEKKLGNSLLVAATDITHRPVTVSNVTNGSKQVTVAAADLGSFIIQSKGTTGGIFENAAGAGGEGAGDIIRINGSKFEVIENVQAGAGATLTLDRDITANEAGATKAVVEWRYADNFTRRLGSTLDIQTSTSASVQNLTGLTYASDLMHIAVVDKDGDWTGQAGTVLETFDSVSKAKNAKTDQGADNYYQNVLRDNSEYIYSGIGLDDNNSYTGTSDFSGTSAWDADAVAGSNFKTFTVRNYYRGLTGGSAGAVTDTFTEGFDQFQDEETVDVSIILGGPSEGTVSKQLVTLAENRKDSLVFLSPPADAVLTSTANPKKGYIATANVTAYRKGINAANEGGDVDYSSNNINVSSSYAVLDSGWKYMFDRFNDKFRYVPLNGDVGGIAVRADFESEAWFSPAGFNRGQVLNAVNIAFNPTKSERDTLYQNGVNPVASFPGRGTVLFGDKTLLSKPSAFDRINVRRLFIVLEKAISTAAQFSLFELNDRFTRAQFKNLIEPFLLDVQARRGITDFRVVCDETNNTGEIIDRNEFVADIFVQPTRSINFITLNFIATRTGVDFSEIGG